MGPVNLRAEVEAGEVEKADRRDRRASARN